MLACGALTERQEDAAMMRPESLMLFACLLGCVETAPPVMPDAWSSDDGGIADGGPAVVSDASPAVPDAPPFEAADAGAGVPDGGRAGLDAGLPLCPDFFAEGVAIFAPESYFFALMAHSELEESAEITAWPWRNSVGTTLVVEREVEWRTSGDTALFSAEPATDRLGRRLRVRALGDAFDGVGREPYLNIEACVRNSCPERDGRGNPCRCASEVCSPLVLVAAVPPLEGTWTVSEDERVIGTYDVLQAGRVLSGWPYAFPLGIDGLGVSGGELGSYIEGAIAADRGSILGLRFSEDGDVLGFWSARRVEP